MKDSTLQEPDKDPLPTYTITITPYVPCGRGPRCSVCVESEGVCVCASVCVFVRLFVCSCLCACACVCVLVL